MNTKTLKNHYKQLMAEERFGLIQIADGRGDVSESERLVNAAPRIDVSMFHHAPYTLAFRELMWFTYLDLLDDAAAYNEMSAKREGQPAGEWSDTDRTVRIVLGLGFQFKAKLMGWALFCAWLGIPPVALWERMNLPGLDRLKRAWAKAQGGLAYRTPAEMVSWMNEIRSPGEPEITEANLPTAVDVARSLYASFREHTDWCR